MAKDVKITITGQNRVGDAAKEATRDLEKMRVPIERVRTGMSGVGAVLRGDVASGLAMIGQSLIGRFGALAAKLGLIGAAFAGGFQVGKWIRDFTGLGNALDKMLIPAAQVSHSIEDIAKKRTDGLNKSLADTRTNLKEIDTAAGKAAQAFAALNEKAAAGVELDVQRKLAELRAAAGGGGAVAGAADGAAQRPAMPEPVAKAKEQEIIATGRAQQAALAESSAKKAQEAERVALEATRGEIVKNERALADYRKAQEEAARLAGLVRADALAGAPGAQAELVNQLANYKTAAKQIEATEAHLTELKKSQVDQQLALSKSEAASQRAVAGVAAAQNEVEAATKGVADAQAEVDKAAEDKRLENAKERLRLEQEIADNALEVDKADLGQRWKKALEETNAAAEDLQNQLAKREAMGEPGTPEFRQARKAQELASKQDRRRRERLDAIGVKIGPDGLIAESVDDAEKRLAKSGRRLSKEEMERLRRDELRRKLREEDLKKKIAEENIRGKEQADIMAWRKSMLATNEAIKEKLTSLLQAAPG